jgi:hypothetical protein
VKTNESFVSLQDETEAAVDGDVNDDLDLVSQLDPKNMKVAELRTELEARNLPSKGEMS